MNKPKSGDLWELEMWGASGRYKKIVLIIETNTREFAGRGTEVNVYKCFTEQGIENMPIWMFSAGRPIYT